MTFNQLGQDGATRDAHHIGRDTGQFDVGALQGFVNAVDQRGALPHKGGAIPGQFAQFPLADGRHETGAQQAVLQQLGQPLGILDIGLAPWHGFDVLGVHQQHFKVGFQDIEDRLPVFAGALHGDVGDAVTGQPV